MSPQADYVVANGTGAAVRSDINGQLAAIVSNNSGATEPATMYAYQWWADTTTGLLKIRNAANNGWITLYQLDGEWSTLAIENGSAAAPSIYFKDSGTDTGIYSPGTDQVAISTGGTVRLSLSTTAVSSALAIDHPLGAVGTPSITFTGDLNTGIYSPAADTLAFVEGGVEAMRIDSSGRVGINTGSPEQKLHVVNTSAGATTTPLLVMNRGNAASTAAQIALIATQSDFSDGQYAAIKAISGGSGTTAHNLAFLTSPSGGTPTERLYISSGGNVGIGTTSPAFGAIDHGVHIYGSGAQEGIRLESTNGSTGILEIYAESGGNTLDTRGSGYLRFSSAATEWGRWDSSGRFLVGTSSSRSWSGVNSQFQIENVGVGLYASQSIIANSSDTTGGLLVLGKSRGTSLGSNTAVQNNDLLGRIYFYGADGSQLVQGATIEGWVDGTPGSNDMPGRLVFSTTADGASSPTERMRITRTGAVLIGKTDESITTVGDALYLGYLSATRSGEPPSVINRLANDGNLIEFRQDSTFEGSISISGTTVSYNGAHLSRWSQLPGGAERTEILRGTVLSNIDEMCGWGEEENEQLNRMKVSDVEGDPNVAGVFQAWDDDDDTYTDDFYCAMTGDFIIRIAEGVTVQRGDLLMSSGDGTAKPQDDDIIRSKTVAKVTSTHVTCTYNDGSYCVPCVLMAC
jgi:hypothetical protein